MFSFVKNRFIFYIIAIVLFSLSVASPWILWLRQGIDMTGGIQIEYSVDGDSSPKQVVDMLKESIMSRVKAGLLPEHQPIITDTLAYQISNTNRIIVEAGIDESWVDKDNKARLDIIESAKENFKLAIKSAFKAIPNTTIAETRYVNIGASFGEYIKSSWYKTLTIAIIAISLYIMYSFWGSIPGMASWPFAVVIALSLMHDVVLSFGGYVLISYFFPQFTIDTFFITAMLTILGYSINDTIVVMDRIRSNLQDKKFSKLPFSKIIDKSIWGTMRRSLFTSVTVVFVLVSVFFFGPDSIRWFALALILGTFIGTYSSVVIASPMLVDFTGKK